VYDRFPIRLLVFHLAYFRLPNAGITRQQEKQNQYLFHSILFGKDTGWHKTAILLHGIGN